jgi:hypothetical protein
MCNKFQLKIFLFAHKKGTNCTGRRWKNIWKLYDICIYIWQYMTYRYPIKKILFFLGINRIGSRRRRLYKLRILITTHIHIYVYICVYTTTLYKC